jgi:pimeloyl-ACP methyl ester carboxylesterase
VILAPYWNHHPSAFENLTADLARDHTVVRYDYRGTGQSTRTGPYDMETGTGDLEAVIEAVGGEVVVVAILDSCNRAVRVAERRPELVRGVIGIAALPAGFDEIRRYTDAMIGSESVIEALLEQLGRDYRGAMRSIVAAANPQMDEDQIRERTQEQVDYLPAEAAVERVHAWRQDDALEPARAIGDRLWLVLAGNVAGQWFPETDEAERLIERLLPEARVEVVGEAS